MAVDSLARFHALNRTSVVDAGIEQIKRLVVEGALAPGQRLPAERALADALGISRPALREAIRALIAMGVLQSRVGSGTYVTSLSAEVLAGPLAFLLEASRPAFFHLFEVRYMLETGAVAVAAQRADERQLASLGVTLARMRQAIDDVERFVDADIAFHRTLHEAAENPLLLELMASVSSLDRRMRLLTSQQLAVREASVREHDAIAAAMASRSPERALAEMRRHLTSSWYDVVGEEWSPPLTAPELIPTRQGDCSV
jgi:GntR family transcriptional repressor for pyruvate dehydrogenase complex